MIKYRGQLRGSSSCFKYMGYNTCFHFMIAVLNLKLCFATDVLTERSGSLHFFHSDLNLLMEFLYFTDKIKPVPRIRD